VRGMLLLTVVYDDEKEDMTEGIENMVECFRGKSINIGVSESLQDKTHFVKIYCGDEDINPRFMNSFNINMANILYNIVIDEFYRKDMQSFLTNTYFFLRYDEIKEVKGLSLKALKSEGPIIDENSIFCMNRKNAVIEKIEECILDNREINIKGFITFRMKEIKDELESVIDRVVEKYMVEKEYNEFIKLLKYFVDIQDSKIEEVNIIVQPDGNYIVRDRFGTDIMDKFLSDLSDSKFSGAVSVDDMLISGLITNAPQKVVIHCPENCNNKELIDTIKNVFVEKAVMCSNCKICNEIKKTTKV
jgi:putative sporulation protein YtxC